MVEQENVLPLTGMSGFLASALNYIKNTDKLRKGLKKKNLNIKVALIATDLPNGALLTFKDHKVKLEPIGEEDWQNPSKWDAKIESDAKTFFDYFMGRLGAVRPILFRKMIP